MVQPVLIWIDFLRASLGGPKGLWSPTSGHRVSALWSKERQSNQQWLIDTPLEVVHSRHPRYHQVASLLEKDTLGHVTVYSDIAGDLGFLASPQQFIVRHLAICEGVRKPNLLGSKSLF